MKTFPEWNEDDYKRIESSKTLSSLIFGNRFKSDQTLYEYLIEFLLVFVSPKDAELETGKMEFHDMLIEKKLSYWVEPRMALRRFVFYDKARKKGTIPADETAYHEMVNMLTEKIDDVNSETPREYIESIQDLFHGDAVVIKNRFWGAQSLMPICPEFVLCGADPNEKNRRKNVDVNIKRESIDNMFSFDKRNFLARGGELYYLHILQGIGDNNEKREKLEFLLNNLVGEQCKKVSTLAAYIQGSWESYCHLDKKKLSKQLNLSFIPGTGYLDCEKHSIDELINYLACKLHPINRVDVLAKGVMFQIMRMMSCRVSNFLGKDSYAWIVDMRSETTDTVKKLAANSYRSLEDDFMTTINKIAREVNVDDKDLMKKIREAKIDSLDIFRSKGKELQCIIPVNGPFERFCLSEDIIRFLVLSLIAPGKKMTLSMFLGKLYEHYKIVIGPEEYRRSLESSNMIEASLANSFTENVVAFQNFLKSTGFLRELSDATSIVVNPYEAISE